MQTYERNTTCQKCGSKTIGTSYDGHADRMKRRCGNCGYGWSELPLDAKEPDEPVPEKEMVKRLRPKIHLRPDDMASRLID